jgi:hypothetical protein
MKDHYFLIIKNQNQSRYFDGLADRSFVMSLRKRWWWFLTRSLLEFSERLQGEGVVKGIKKPYLNRRIISFLRLQAWVL